MKILIAGILLSLTFNTTFAAKDILVPEMGEDTNTGSVPRLRSDETMPLMVEVGCHAANNRQTHNPISPNSKITSTIVIKGQSYALKWPSSLTRGVSGALAHMGTVYNQSLQHFCTTYPDFCKVRVAPTGCTDFNTCTQAVFNDGGTNAITAFINHTKNFRKSQYGGDDSEKFDAKMLEFYQNIFNSNNLRRGVAWGTLHGKFLSSFKDLCEKGTIAEQRQCIGDHGCEAVCLLGTNIDSCVNSCRTNIQTAGSLGTCTLNGSPTLSCEKLILANVPFSGVGVGDISIRHAQSEVPGGGAKRQFYAYNGSMTGRNTVSLLYSGDSVTGVKIKASFPGQDGYCGGYHSPLMLFFDKKHPKFLAKTAFLDDKKIRKTYWPEANHHGYFLAKLKSLKMKDYKITQADQLFGNNGAYADGFAVLKNYDEDQNGYIGKGKNGKYDPVFKLLVLWKDKNGDGNSSPDEIFSLKKFGITKLYTDYDSTYYLDYGNRAKARGRSIFEYIDKLGKIRKGHVLDIFFSEVYY